MNAEETFAAITRKLSRTSPKAFISYAGLLIALILLTCEPKKNTSQSKEPATAAATPTPPPEARKEQPKYIPPVIVSLREQNPAVYDAVAPYFGNRNKDTVAGIFKAALEFSKKQGGREDREILTMQLRGCTIDGVAAAEIINGLSKLKLEAQRPMAEGVIGR